MSTLQYGYFGTRPTAHFEYCSDEDMNTDALCDQGVNGTDVAQYLHTATTQLIAYTAAYDFDFSQVAASVTAMFLNYAKAATLDSAQKTDAIGFRTTDLAAIAAATGTSATQKANIKTLQDLATKNLAPAFAPPAAN